MPNYLSVGTAIEKNKLFTDVAFINLLQIDVINPKTKEYIETLYVVNNKEDVVYLGQTYTATSFSLDVKKDSGSVPSLTCSFMDPTRAFEGILQQYEGGTGFKVRVLFVNTSALDQPPELQEEFEIMYTANSGYNITATLGAENPLNKRFPRRACYREMCSWIYKSPECGYCGELKSCDYTLTGKNGCKTHNNTHRYGGFPGVQK